MNTQHDMNGVTGADGRPNPMTLAGKAIGDARPTRACSPSTSPTTVLVRLPQPRELELSHLHQSHIPMCTETAAKNL